jgi:hypothetical protein
MTDNDRLAPMTREDLYLFCDRIAKGDELALTTLEASLRPVPAQGMVGSRKLPPESALPEWIRVPREPTVQIINAVCDEMGWERHDPTMDQDAINIYRAILSASEGRP